MTHFCEELNYLSGSEEYLKAVVYISTSGGSGTGFIVHPNGYIVTCAHVVKDKANVRVRIITQTATYKRARVLFLDDSIDFALLGIDGENYSFVETGGTDKVIIGDEIIILGYPFGSNMADRLDELNVSLTRGFISSFQVIDGIRRGLLDAAARAGNSGSPVISRKTGRVIGILAGSYVGGKNNQEEINYMIPISTILDCTKKSLSKLIPENKAKEQKNPAPFGIPYYQQVSMEDVLDRISSRPSVQNRKYHSRSVFSVVEDKLGVSIVNVASTVVSGIGGSIQGPRYQSIERLAKKLCSSIGYTDLTNEEFVLKIKTVAGHFSWNVILPAAISIISEHEDMPLKKGLVIAGQIDSLGHVIGVKSLSQILKLCDECSGRVVLLPTANAIDFANIPVEYMKKLGISFYSNFQEAVNKSIDW